MECNKHKWVMDDANGASCEKCGLTYKEHLEAAMKQKREETGLDLKYWHLYDVIYIAEVNPGELTNGGCGPYDTFDEAWLEMMN